MKDLRAYLRSLDVETLADLLHEQAERDPELRGRLRSLAGDVGGDLAEVRSLLDRGPCHASFAEAPKITAVLDTLRHLLDSGTRADVAPLARRTVDRIADAIETAEDPSGAMGAELQRAVGLYARACAAHPPEPAKLAEWILGFAFGGSGRPEIELAVFAQALGEPGLALVKSTVDTVLAEGEGGRRRRIAEGLNEQLAEISGDVDTLREILSGRLPRLDVSLKIVRVLRATGRTSEAIAHAAQALARSASGARAPAAEVRTDGISANLEVSDQRDRPDAPSDGAARSPTDTETSEESGRHDDVLTSRRSEFERSPDRRAYLALRESVTEAGQWDKDREWALGVLRERAGDDRDTADEFARILHEERLIEEAWQVTQRHDCSLQVKLELAEARENDHPADAIGVYQAHIEELIRYKDADHYRHAAKRLKKLRMLYRNAGQAAEFGDYLASLVRAHRRKARLLTEIRNARIALPKS